MSAKWQRDITIAMEITIPSSLVIYFD